MGVKRNDAVVKGAQIMLWKEECAKGMEQKSNDAAEKGAIIKLGKEECARDMVQRKVYLAAAKDALIMLRMGSVHQALVP